MRALHAQSYRVSISIPLHYPSATDHEDTYDITHNIFFPNTKNKIIESCEEICELSRKYKDLHL